MRCYCLAQSRGNPPKGSFWRATLISFLPSIQRTNTVNLLIFFFFFTAIDFTLFHLNFWTLLKDTESWCSKAFKGFVLLFYDKQNKICSFLSLNPRCFSPALWNYLILWQQDPIFSWTLSMLVLPEAVPVCVQCFMPAVWGSMCLIGNLETPPVFFLYQKNPTDTLGCEPEYPEKRNEGWVLFWDWNLVAKTGWC